MDLNQLNQIAKDIGYSSLKNFFNEILEFYDEDETCDDIEELLGCIYDTLKSFNKEKNK